jgi:glutamine amidotransferase
VLAHNGTVRKIIQKPEFMLGSFKPCGETYSEYAFCYLLDKIRDKPDDIKEVLKTEAQKIKYYGKFNFLLSDGETLFAHGDNSLYFVQRKFPFDTVTLKYEQYSVNLGEIKNKDEKAIIIATEPLTENEDWKKIVGIKIFKAGEEVQ